jgi:hypothetical protein
LIDVAPGSTHVPGVVDRIFLVDGVGEFDISVLMLATFRIHVIATIDPGTHQQLSFTSCTNHLCG